MSRLVQVVFALLAVGLIMGGSGLVAAMFERVDGVGDLTRDATAVAGMPWWIGAVSRLTNLCWAVAATANLLAARGAAQSMRRPLLLLGLLCGALAIDDTMLVHEAVMRGGSDKLLLGGYAIAGLVLGWWWWRASADTWVKSAFFVGAMMLAVSMAADLIFHGLMGFEDGSTLLFVEDGAKLVGVIAWCLCGVWAHRDGGAGERSTTQGVSRGAVRRSVDNW